MVTFESNKTALYSSTEDLTDKTGAKFEYITCFDRSLPCCKIYFEPK
jgi:hypothetical protein